MAISHSELSLIFSVEADEYDGAEYANVQVIRGKFGLLNAEREAAAELARQQREWNGCSHYGTQYRDPLTGKMVWPHINGQDQVSF